MKFKLITGLLGAAAAIDMNEPHEELDLQTEAQELEGECQNYNQIAESSLIDLEEDELIETEESQSKTSYKKLYGKSKTDIAKENNKILSTQKKCLAFVEKHRGHMAVCNWCRTAKMPKVYWKWDSTHKVWYRFYRGTWHYWGPSKQGFTAEGWTWYNGYWHHEGFIFKFHNGIWFRFQGGNWVKYGKSVPIKPKAPHEETICRPFYKLEKAGFPSSLATKDMPRCIVGSGKNRAIYIWKGHSACRFLGGKLGYQKIHKCKKG